MTHLRKITSLALALGLVLPAGAALADPSMDIPEDVLDRIAPPIPVAQPAAPEDRPTQEQVAEEMADASRDIRKYIVADDDGTLDFDEERARAEGVDPALIAAAEDVEERLDDAEDGVVTPESGEAEGVPVTFADDQQCGHDAAGTPTDYNLPSGSGDNSTCKPQVQASSSRRIERNPVIDGITYNGYKMTTTQRYKATAICAFYSWSVIHEFTQEVWVLTDYLVPQRNTHRVYFPQV